MKKDGRQSSQITKKREKENLFLCPVNAVTWKSNVFHSSILHTISHSEQKVVKKKIEIRK